MATITFNLNVDPNNALLNMPTEIDGVATATATVFEIGDPRFTVLRLEGYGFSYSAPNTPSAGTLTGFSLVQNGAVAVTVTNLSSRVSLPEVEALRLGGAPGAMLTYLLADSDAVVAGAGDQVILTEGGNDTVNGGAGADYIIAGDGDDFVISGLGQGPTGGATERLIGGSGTDRLFMDRSDQPFAFVFDIMVGGVTALVDGTHISGFEHMEFRSGSGSDVLSGGELSDTMDGAAGSDHISGRGGNDILTGGDGADRIEGGSGDDLATGDDGADQIDGGLGNDTLSGGDGVDALDGGKGDDMLDGGAEADNLFGDDGNDFLFGGLGADYLEGGAGNDIINGGSGPDVLSGGQGDDVYFVDDADDAVSELRRDGYDTIFTSVSYTLASAAEIENLRPTNLQSKTSLKFKGNDFSNYIYGNAGANLINGAGGADKLKGGLGRDTFVFDTPLRKGKADKILDFRVKDDSIRLGETVFKDLPGDKYLHKSVFCLGKKAIEADDRIIYDPRKGYLYYDADGNGTAKALLFAKLPKKLKLTEADFLI